MLVWCQDSEPFQSPCDRCLDLERMPTRIGYLIVTACLLASTANAAQLYSVYWLSDPQPCHGLVGKGMPGPIVSKSYPPCSLSGINLSICRNTVSSVDNDPWEAGGPITVVGYSVSLWLTQQNANGSMVVGQAGGDGPDIFATLSTVGTRSLTEWLASGSGIRIPDNSTRRGSNAHFDVYAGCDGSGQLQTLVSIYYTSP